MRHSFHFKQVAVVWWLLLMCSMGFSIQTFGRQTNGPFGGRQKLSCNHSSGDSFAGALFRSADKGDNWSQIDTGLASTSVASLAISINDVIFADLQWKTIRGRAQS